MSFEQILKIGKQLLSPLNDISYLKIDERSLECPVRKNVTEKYCNSTACKNVKELNDLLKISEDTDIQCYLNNIQKSKNDTKKFFEDASKKCETCEKLENKSEELIRTAVASGKYK